MPAPSPALQTMSYGPPPLRAFRGLAWIGILAGAIALIGYGDPTVRFIFGLDSNILNRHPDATTSVVLHVVGIARAVTLVVASLVIGSARRPWTRPLVLVYLIAEGAWHGLGTALQLRVLLARSLQQREAVVTICQVFTEGLLPLLLVVILALLLLRFGLPDDPR